MTEAGLVPELPAKALSDVPDPEVQQAVDDRRSPDSPWAPGLFDDFLETRGRSSQCSSLERRRSSPWSRFVALPTRTQKSVAPLPPLAGLANTGIPAAATLI